MNEERIGKCIKELRKKNNLTQNELAKKLSVTYQAVSKWETGKSIPDIEILKEISDIFNVDIAYLIGSNKGSTKKPMFITLISLIVIILVITGIIVKNTKNNPFEFNTISTSCKEFTLSGSAAYNKKKTAIYINNIEYCGKEDITKKKYEKISCQLIENYKGEDKVINNCTEVENSNLKDFLRGLEISVNHYETKCQSLEKGTLYLKIIAKDDDNKEIVYNLPIVLNDKC